jgi:hypothetical protein
MSTLREALQRETWNDRDGETDLTVDEAILALRQWLADEGLVVVPAMPTEQMQKVGSEARWVTPLMNPDSPFDMYRAMIAAAPDALETKP